MDNRILRVNGVGRTRFDMAMVFAFDGAPGGKATHFKADPEKGLLLALSESSKLDPLPYPMDRAAATEFVWHWLAAADYGRKPGHDGDNEGGWLVYCEDWGHIGNPYTFVGILPIWAMYGK